MAYEFRCRGCGTTDLTRAEASARVWFEVVLDGRNGTLQLGELIETDTDCRPRISCSRCGFEGDERDFVQPEGTEIPTADLTDDWL